MDTNLSDLPTIKPAKQFAVDSLVLGRYRITGQLGQGAMGIVYRCRDEIGGIDVALKTLPPELSHSPDEMEEIRDNFKLVEKLHHPNIAAVKNLEYDENAGDYFLIMECVDGVSLRRFRRDNKENIDINKIIPVVKQIAEALDYAHSKKVIHRDIKPSNIMIPPDGTVKILDFGLAAQIRTSISRVSRINYRTSGTGAYMAPEQWKGLYQDASTDQYALAVLTYELLAGRCPFENTEPSILREIVINDQPEKPENLDNKRWTVLQKALDKDRKQRFSSCLDFANALEHNTTKGRITTKNTKNPKIFISIFLVIAVLTVLGLKMKNYSPKNNNTKKSIEQKKIVQKKSEPQQSQPVIEKQNVYIKKEKISSDFSQTDAIKLKIEAEDALKFLVDNAYSDFKNEIKDAGKQFRIGKEAKISSDYTLACKSFIEVTNIFSKVKKEIKNNYDSLLEKAAECNRQKKWIEAENFADEAINTGYNDVSKAKTLLEEIKKNYQTVKDEKNKEEGEKFLAENKKKNGVITTPSGLQYIVIKKGEGNSPSDDDTVLVDYVGTLIDGTEFDSSYDRDQPATFPVKGVIKGWAEALKLMKPGSKFKLFIPSDLAYGERGAGKVIEPDATLIFEVEFLDIK